MGENYGYVRVSSTDQNEDRQILVMSDIGIPLKNIYIDKASGKDFERPQYKRMLKSIKMDDTLYIVSIDRLGRNYEEIRNQWMYLTHDLKINICVIDMPLLDTRTCKDLLGTFISDLVLQILSFVAENERENIRIRQRQGIDAAKSKGVHFGRSKKDLGAEFDEYMEMYAKGLCTGKMIEKKFAISASTFYRRIHEYRQSQGVLFDIHRQIC